MTSGKDHEQNRGRFGDDIGLPEDGRSGDRGAEKL